MANSTEPKSDFLMKKVVGFSCGMLSAIAAACSAYALRRIVYPSRKKSSSSDTSSIFIIVLKLFMATSVADVIYSLNNTLAFSDWNPLSPACKARGIWFQIGFQSSFFFTACTAYELYNMITTTMQDSSFAFSNSYSRSTGESGYRRRSTYSFFKRTFTRFQLYFIMNSIFVTSAVVVLYIGDGFGASSRTRQHTLCWVYTDRWTTLVAMVPSFICWIFNCIFIGFSVCRLWVLSRYTGSSNRRISSGRSSGRSSGSSRGDEYGDVLEGEVDTMSSIRSGFIPVIRKMILFPLVTLILWSIPIAEAFILAFNKEPTFDNRNLLVETITQAAINLQGLTNCIILILTNSLVRSEISRCCCGSCKNGGCFYSNESDGGGDGDEYSNHRDSSSVVTEDSYNDDGDHYYYEYEEERQNNDDGYRANNNSQFGHGNHIQGRHQYSDSVDEPLFLPSRTEPALSEDVSIMRFANQRVGDGGGSIHSDDGGDGLITRNLTTPDVPSLDGESF